MILCKSVEWPSPFLLNLNLYTAAAEFFYQSEFDIHVNQKYSWRIDTY